MTTRPGRSGRPAHVGRWLVFYLSNRPGDPAIHADILPCYVAGTAGGQKNNHIRDLIGSSIPPHWDSVAELMLFGEAIDETG